VSLELGGNAPFIVFDDADLERAVEGALIAKYRNAGQTCVCVNRFLVQDGIYEAFVSRLAERVGEFKVGDGFAAGVTQGPLINERAVAKVEDHVQDALSKGARLICGGERHALGNGFFQPTVLADLTLEMKVAREETFGPLAALFRFGSEAEAVQLANDTEYGLAAYCYTRDLGRAWRMSEALEYGMVGINEGLISTEVAPFGGIKSSGLGREGSKYGIEDYLEIKYTLMGGL
jgi:succinate-semialdehyde dehydrogenase/glutarate-semialdehyde dehydrogenase